MTAVLRTCAIAIALAALVDPSWRIQRDLPLAVRFHTDEDDADAMAVRDRLRRSLGGRVEFREHGTPDAVVAIDDGRGELASLTVPVSTVSLAGDRDVAVIDAPASVSMPSGTAVSLQLALSGRGVRGTTSTVTVEESGVEIGSVDHAWTHDGYAALSIPYLAVEPGSRRVTIRVRPVTGESRVLNNTADVKVVAIARPIRVAVIEARPSWPAGFVRRALEDDPAFHVSSILRVSKGVSARSGDVSRELRQKELHQFDVVLIGAPEELQTGELDALREFAAVRGGTVILLPDTRAAGAYRSLLPGSPSEELLPQPQKLAPAGLMASEIVHVMDDSPSRRRADVTVLAQLANKAIVFEWPFGDGRFVFSGALDAWRYRADTVSSFGRFWRQTVLGAGLSAPPRLAASLNPAVVKPDERSRLTVRLRRTEFADAAVIAATIVDRAGHSDMVRLWPTAEPGVFEGYVSAASSGLHDIRVAADSGATADSVLIVDAAATRPRWPRLAGIPRLTGGVAVEASDVAPLVRHLSSLPRRTGKEPVHPLRSAWWMIPFAATLCAEWVLRRKRGER